MGVEETVSNVKINDESDTSNTTESKTISFNISATVPKPTGTITTATPVAIQNKLDSEINKLKSQRNKIVDQFNKKIKAILVKNEYQDKDISLLQDRQHEQFENHNKLISRINEIESEAEHGFNVNLIFNSVEAIVIVLLVVIYFATR